jgi:endonuclease YncB( thermonuclease family)
MNAWILALLLLAGCSTATARQNVSVHDGDTLTVDGTRWRLWGVDAPELMQECEVHGSLSSCGLESRESLEALVSSQRVTCTPVGKSYDRVVGKCFAGAVDLSAAQARSGWAFDYRRYSHGAYAPDEQVAKLRRLGIWRGKIMPPWDYRRTQRR